MYLIIQNVNKDNKNALSVSGYDSKTQISGGSHKREATPAYNNFNSTSSLWSDTLVF